MTNMMKHLLTLVLAAMPLLVSAQSKNVTVDAVGQLSKQIESSEKFKISELTDGHMADVTINNVNIPDTEMTSVLCTKDDGVVYFFSMATSLRAGLDATLPVMEMTSP